MSSTSEGQASWDHASGTRVSTYNAHGGEWRRAAFGPPCWLFGTIDEKFLGHSLAPKSEDELPFAPVRAAGSVAGASGWALDQRVVPLAGLQEVG